MLKRGITLLFSMVIIISILPVTVFATEFSDIPNNWSREVLKNAVSNGLLYGNNEQIRPDGNLTRSELATIVNRAFNADEEALISQFSDVSEDAWYYDEMAKAVQMGTLKGYDNALNPENSITREEAFVVLARAFNLSNENHSTLESFIDRDQISFWAKDSVTSLVAEGYIVGTNGKLKPKNKITRAEFAQVMDRLVKTYIKEAGTYTMVNKGNIMINVPNVTLKNITINGDLIIGDGVGDGDVFLENVIVTGRTVVRGGGENSIKIIGNSNLQNIIVARVNGVVRIYGEEGSDLGQVTVNGHDDVIVEGRFKNVKVASSGVVVIAKQAMIENVDISASNAGLIVSKGSNIEVLTLNEVEPNVEVLGAVKKIDATEKAVETLISVAEGGQVEEVLGKAKGTKIKGKGSVKRVEAKADNVKVNTANTKVQVDKDVKGVKANGKDLSGNTSTEDKVDTIDKKDRKEKKGSKSSGRRDDDNDTTESDLVAYHKVIKSVKEANYTVESWKAYEKVLKENIVTSKDTQSKVDAAVAAIKIAQAALVKKEQAPLVARIEIVKEQVLLGYDKVKISLNVEKPEEYMVGSSTMSAFIYNQDGTFTGVVKVGTTAKDIQVSKKEGKIAAEIVKMLEFLPGVYDVHVKLAVDSPESYTVLYKEKAFKLEDGVFKGSSYTNSITVEHLVISKKLLEKHNNQGGQALE